MNDGIAVRKKHNHMDNPTCHMEKGANDAMSLKNINTILLINVCACKLM